MYPNEDAPYFISGFTGATSVIAGGILAYATLPLWLMWEANRRKRKTGFAIPIQAMEDEENSQVSTAAHDKLHQVNAIAEKQALEKEDISHNEVVALEERHIGKM